MRPLGLFSQIGTIALSVAIVFLYTAPLFGEIGATQTQIVQYTQERERVTDTNDRLTSFISQLNSISTDDRNRLETYLPDSIDEIVVLRDLEILAEITGVNYSAISYDGLFVNEDEEIGIVDESDPLVTTHSFSLVAQATYDNLKDFFSLLEQNKYPLQIQSLSLTPDVSGLISIEATIITYSKLTNEVIE